VEIRGPVPRDTAETNRCICSLPETTSPGDFFKTAASMKLSLLVFEHYPRAMHPTLLAQPLGMARSQSSFWGGILILATEEDVIPTPAINPTFPLFEFDIHGLLPVLAIAEREGPAIAERLRASDAVIEASDIREWILCTHEVLEKRAQIIDVDVEELAEKTSFSLSQFMVMMKLFPLMYPKNDNREVKLRWISQNLGFKDLASKIAGTSNRPVLAGVG